MLRSARSSALASATKPCRRRSTPSSRPIWLSAVTERLSSTPGGASARSPSRRLSMALLDLATGTLVAEPADAATELEPNADGAALAAAGNAGPIAIKFPVFNDGRGISLAVLLRERHGFKGEIRAIGHL